MISWSYHETYSNFPSSVLEILKAGNNDNTNLCPIVLIAIFFVGKVNQVLKLNIFCECHVVAGREREIGLHG